jgi:phosphoglycerate dehydrogenase-like enzyme
MGWERENEIEVKVDGKSVGLIGAGAYGRGVCGEDCGCGID